MTERVQVILESECPAADREAVAAVFADAGIAADVRATYVREPAGDLPWLVMIGLPAWTAGTFVKAALQSAGNEAGGDGWRALMQMVSGLYRARRVRAAGGGVSIVTASPRAEIAIPPGLPEEAYRRLFALEEPRAPLSGMLKWSPEAGAWADALAGELRCGYPGCPELATQGRASRPRRDVMVRRDFCDPHAAAADAGDEHAWAG